MYFVRVFDFENQITMSVYDYENSLNESSREISNLTERQRKRYRTGTESALSIREET
jgi:hypothetical protein